MSDIYQDPLHSMPGLGDRALLFLHVPKAAGTSLRELLRRRFPPEDVLGIHHLNVENDQPAISSGRYRFVGGHIPYAIAEWFPKFPFIFMLLREPVDRAVSTFHYMKQAQEDVCRRAQEGKLSVATGEDFIKASTMTLHDYVRQEPDAAARHMGNLQVEMLSRQQAQKALWPERSAAASVTAEDLEIAKTRLASLDAFGLVERLPESIEYLAHALRTRPFDPVSWSNQTLSRPQVEELDPETRALIEEMTFYDRQLYAFAAELFEERIAAMRRGERKPSPASTQPERGRPATFIAGGPVPGWGWYAAEANGSRWFNWTGPDRVSWIELGTPGERDCVLKIGVVHALSMDSLSGLEVFINGKPVVPELRQEEGGYTITAPVPRSMLRGAGENNIVTLRVPNPSRACDSQPGNNDSRLLGIAVHRIGLEDAAGA